MAGQILFLNGIYAQSLEPHKLRMESEYIVPEARRRIPLPFPSKAFCIRVCDDFQKRRFSAFLRG